jgi:hypothetical protein
LPLLQPAKDEQHRNRGRNKPSEQASAAEQTNNVNADHSSASKQSRLDFADRPGLPSGSQPA